MRGPGSGNAASLTSPDKRLPTSLYESAFEPSHPLHPCAFRPSSSRCSVFAFASALFVLALATIASFCVMKTTIREMFVFGATLLMAQGCAKTSSSALKVDQMKAEIEVNAQDNGNSRVRVTLTELGKVTRTYVDLTSRDKLYVIAGTASRVELTKNETLSVITYDTTLTGQSSQATNYKIEFVRGDGFKGAPETNCALPASFSITSPAEDQAFSRVSNDVPFTVTAGNNNYKFKLAGSCINTIEKSVTDAADGSFTVAKTEFVSPAAEASSNCDLTATLIREAQGTLDSAWGSGSVLCSQERTRKIRSTP